MSEQPAGILHPAVALCNAVCFVGALTCFIVGIMFWVDPEAPHYPERAEVIGPILTAVGGIIIGIQLLWLLAVVCLCYGILVAAT